MPTLQLCFLSLISAIHAPAPEIAPAPIATIETPSVASDVVAVDFSTLSSFDWQEGMTLPAKIKALDGKKIGVTGFVRSFDGSDEGITDFSLVDQNCDCEGFPRMNEVIVCAMPEGTSIDSDGSPIRVIGKFEVGEVREDDYVTSIFRLTVERVD